ncbi:MAG: crossover junction endodeoxyribonuclease RuvC [Myxococcota bacterium]
MTDAARVLGVDPGSHRTGWGLVQRDGSRLTYLASGTITAGREEMAMRLVFIAESLERVIDQHRPHALAIETVFHAKNARSALLLGHARGVAIVCAARRLVPVFEYTAGQIKCATAGHGRADKRQVQAMVRKILGHQGEMSLDASDALAAAICHSQTESTPTARALREALTEARTLRPRRRTGRRRRA